jgi:hypothetical protein
LKARLISKSEYQVYISSKMESWEIFGPRKFVLMWDSLQDVNSWTK